MSEAVKTAFLGGTGKEGMGLALRFAAAGLDVAIGSRDAQRAAAAAGRVEAALKERGSPRAVRHGSNEAMVADAGVVFLTVPFAHAAETLRGCRDRLRQGSIIVDATVPLRFEGRRVGVLPLQEGSGSASLAPLVPPGVDLVAAFKTIPAEVLAELGQRLDCDVFVCGDAPAAVQRVMQLLSAIPDLRPIDAGTLETAGTLERMCALAVGMNRRYRSKGSRFRVVGLPPADGKEAG